MYPYLSISYFKICFQTNSQLFNSGIQSLKNYILYKKLQIRILYRLLIFIDVQYNKQLYVALFQQTEYNQFKRRCLGSEG